MINLSVSLLASGEVEERKKVKLTFTTRNDGASTARKGSAECALTCKVASSSGSCPFPSNTKVSIWQDVAPGKSASYVIAAKHGTARDRLVLTCFQQ